MADQTPRAPRIPLDVKVNCGDSGIAYSKNISTSGIALITDYSLEEGKFLQLNFFLPGTANAIQAFAKVMRIVKASENFFEIGLTFWEINDEDKDILFAFFQ